MIGSTPEEQRTAFEDDVDVLMAIRRRQTRRRLLTG
jgi:hypothetical protein